MDLLGEIDALQRRHSRLLESFAKLDQHADREDPSWARVKLAAERVEQDLERMDRNLRKAVPGGRV